MARPPGLVRRSNTFGLVFEDKAIYLSRESWQHGVLASITAVSPEPLRVARCPVLGGTVTIWGTFSTVPFWTGLSRFV